MFRPSRCACCACFFVLRLFAAFKNLTLLFDHCIKVFRLVWPLGGEEPLAAENVEQDSLGGLAVLFVHGAEKGGEHKPHHKKDGGGVAERPPSHKKHGDANCRRRAEAQGLPFGQAEDKFCLDPREVFGDLDISHFKGKIFSGGFVHFL